MRILVVEDDPHMRELLDAELRDRDFDVLAVATADDALRHAIFADWSVIILDINLPDGDGFAVCRQIRKSGQTTPILMLTGRDAVADRVNGLEAGGDDYLIKPFALDELVARLHALSRRAPELADPVIRIADLEVDTRSRRVERSGETIDLTAKEFALLEVFARNAGAVLDRARITAWVWDDNHDPASNALEVLVRRLRAKVDDPYEQKLIQTLRGAGYRFGP